jgi:NAD(P)-dependent dehydrogenase (short-subunit alcohol dehydrogenase family)
VARAGEDHAFGPDDIVDLTGRTALVTGANSGVGYEAALELAAHGAHVVLACRDPERGAEALQRIEGLVPLMSLEVLLVDLSDQVSVHRAAQAFADRHDRLDILLNNAGVMAPPLRLTPDGFELQMATNHLGPFALTGLLLPHLLTTPGSRVVTVTSPMHRLGRIDPAQLAAPAHYERWTAYGRTKLANLLFTAELSRRLEAAGAATTALAAHPGWARTNLAAAGPSLGAGRLRRASARLAARSLGRPAHRGALPLLYAATVPGLPGGILVGPTGPGQLGGAAGVVSPAAKATRASDAAALWEASEALTGVHYDLGPGTARRAA